MYLPQYKGKFKQGSCESLCWPHMKDVFSGVFNQKQSEVKSFSTAINHDIEHLKKEKYTWLTETYLELSQRSKTEPFAKIINSFKELTILPKSSILDVWLGLKLVIYCMKLPFPEMLADVRNWLFPT